MLRSLKPAQSLLTIIDIATKHQHIIAELDSKDTYKPLQQSLQEVKDGIKVLEFCALQKHIFNKMTTENGYIYRAPLGNCLFILPFNYPFLLFCWKVGPALSAGNSCIVKPSPYTPSSASYIANMLKEPDILQVVQTSEQETINLIKSDTVDHVGFIGGQEGAKAIWNASYGKSMSIESSGCSVLIVHKSAKCEQVASIVTDAVLENAGQNCCKPSFVLLPKRKLKYLCDKISMAMSQYKLIPLINDKQKEIFDKKIALRSKMYKYLKIPKQNGLSNFVNPRLFVSSKELAIEDYEEIFGPTCIIIPYDNMSQIDAIMSSNKQRLAMGILSKDLQFASNLIHKYRFGINWINSYNTCPPDVCFGGSQLSGTSWSKDLGLESIYGLTRLYSIVK